MQASNDALVVRETAYSHQDAVSLTALAQNYYHQIYGGPDDSPMDSDEFAPPHGVFFVAYAADVAVCMGGWRFHEPIDGWPGRRPAEIRRMFVHPDHRGRGFARTLLTTLEQSAQGAGADSMVLETGHIQTEAIGLYRATGYVDIPAFGHYADVEGSAHLGKVMSAG